MSAEKQRDQAILILDSNLAKLSKLYKESYLSKGKGALLIYATDVINNGAPNKGAYRTKKEILEVFDTPTTSAKLAKMINDYDSKTEGIMALVTSHSNATYFVTVKLE